MSDLRTKLQAALGSTYTLERELGGGGMSRTYVAMEHSLSRRVVVKVLSPELLAGISVERFKREVLLAAALQHPHVVPVLASGDAEGLPWFSMPYVEGDSLRVRLAKGALSIGEVTGILRDVARALEFAHGHGIVHRDIKPDNVLLAGSSATVTDFGIAKAVERARTTVTREHGAGNGAPAPEPLTALGLTLGTPAYMAPEQAAGDPHLDHRSDIYAFGAMAYELLAGRPPFVADSPARLISAHFNQIPADVRELRPDTPPVLADLVMQCLAKEPGDRPQRAKALVQVLDTVTASGEGGIPPAALRAPQLHLGRALALWAGATAAVSVTAWAATRTIGLPDWALPGAVGVMIAGLPAVLGTWYVQRATHRVFTQTPTLTPGGSPSPQGTLATMAVKAAPHVSWRRTWLGGAIAVGTFGTLLVAFMVLRALGIGPMGSLRGAGAFGDRETLVVADFRSPASDSTLGATASEAIRTDLAQSANLTVMTRASIREILQLMGRASLRAVEFDVAREIATRQGAKAVLDGAIDKLGPSYVVSARLVSSLDGRELATFRETATDDGELVAALGRLSRDVRGKIGESLKHIRDTQSLERVTTSSLPALRKYVEGSDALSLLGDQEGGRKLLYEALAYDSTFAMAWRRIASSYAGSGRDRQAQLHAIKKAYEYRDRLSENERLLTEATYYSFGPNPDNDRSIAAYESLIALDSTNSAALNNGATRLFRRGDHAKAIALLERATRLERPFGGAFTNLVDLYLAEGDLSGAERTAARLDSALPQYSGRGYARLAILAAKGQLDSARAVGEAEYQAASSTTRRDMYAYYTGSVAILRGQPREGLRWLSLGNQAQASGTAGKQAALLVGLDSAFTAGYWLEDATRSRELLRRALARMPIESLPPADRPWSFLADIAAATGDADGARGAYAGWLRDTVVAGSTPGRAAVFRARIAMAEGRGGEAVAALREAERSLALPKREQWANVAMAFDVAGQPDSALAYFERFVERPVSDLDVDPNFLAGSYKRLGELYDARGDAARAEHFYQRFVDLWKNADPELQPKVQQARERIAALRRTKG